MTDEALNRTAGRSAPRALVAATRPRQWSKNVLVLAAPATAGDLAHAGVAVRSVLALIAFTAISASAYLVNDIVDVAADRLHPVKRRRPIAAGDLTVPAAAVTAGVLLAGALAVAALLSANFLILVLVYIACSQGYNFGLKRVPVVEMALVSSGFVLRASAGGAASHISISAWFLIVTSAGALFVITGKRTAESMLTDIDPANHRAVLNAYPANFLSACRMIAACTAVTSYCLWVFEGATRVGGARIHNLVWYEFSIIPFVLSILIAELAIEQGRGGEPEELFLRERSLQLGALAWALFVALGIYA